MKRKYWERFKRIFSHPKPIVKDCTFVNNCVSVKGANDSIRDNSFAHNA